MSPALTPYPSFALPFPPTDFSHRYAYQPYSPLSSLSKLTLNPISSGLPSWSAPLRDGLPTPPADMNGVAYNSQPAPSSTYTYHHHNGQYAAKSSSNRVPLANTVSNANYLPPLTKQAVQVDESTDKSHKRSEKEALPSYSQIPTTIRKNGGNLPEFAAQVSSMDFTGSIQANFLDCVSVLV